MTVASFDAVVIGGGPSGTVAARALAKRGRSVLLVDRDEHPRWKVCGACLSGRGRAALAAEGLGDLAADLGATRPVSFELHHDGRRISLPLDGTAVVSRAALDRALLDAARSSGAEIRTGWTAALGPSHGSVRSVELRSGDHRETVRARLVLGATGLTPLLAAGARDVPEVEVSATGRIGAGALLPAGAFGADSPDPSAVRMVVGPTGYVGMGTTEDGRLDVAAALDAEAVRAAGGTGEAVAALLRSAGHPEPSLPPDEGWRGTPRLTRAAPRPGAHRLLLVGDAASYVEPFTGEGMTWAVEDARAVVEHAEALLSGSPPESVVEAWTSSRSRRTRRARRLVRAVAWLTRSPGRTRVIFGLLSSLPVLARPFVRAAASMPPRPDLTFEQDPA